MVKKFQKFSIKYGQYRKRNLASISPSAETAELKKQQMLEQAGVRHPETQKSLK